VCAYRRAGCSGLSNKGLLAGRCAAIADRCATEIVEEQCARTCCEAEVRKKQTKQAGPGPVDFLAIPEVVTEIFAFGRQVRVPPPQAYDYIKETGFCQDANGNDAGATNMSGVATLDACKSVCDRMPTCYGVEWLNVSDLKW
jgi:hypothetical protein